MADSRNFLLQQRMLGACSDAYITRPLDSEKTTTKESYRRKDRRKREKKKLHRHTGEPSQTRKSSKDTFAHAHAPDREANKEKHADMCTAAAGIKSIREKKQMNKQLLL